MAYLVCENCGEEFELDPGETPENFDNECEDCGGTLKYRADDSSIDKMYCSNCDHEIDTDSYFCKNCGQELSQNRLVKKHGKITSLNWKAIAIGCVLGTVLGISLNYAIGVWGLFVSPFLVGLITSYLVNKDLKNGLIHSVIANFIFAIIFNVEMFILIYRLPEFYPELFDMSILFLVIFLIIGAIGGIFGDVLKKM